MKKTWISLHLAQTKRHPSSMSMEHQSLQREHELQRQSMTIEQCQERERLLQQQHTQFLERQAAFAQLQNEYQQEPTPTREHELLMLQQVSQYVQEIFVQQQQHLLERHEQDRLRLQERQWHQEQLLLHQIQQQQQHYHLHQQRINQRQQLSPASSSSGTPQAGQEIYTQQHSNFIQQPSLSEQSSPQVLQELHHQQNGLHHRQNNLHHDDTAEAMDVDDEQQLLSIASAIINLRQQPATVESASVSAWASGPAYSPFKDDNDPDAVVVLDTNILISHLNFLKSIIDIYGGKKEPYIVFVIPWIVVQELDGLKKDGFRKSGEVNLASKALRATKFLEEEFEKPEDLRILRGQKISEHHEELDKQAKNDDKILDCCCYFRNLYPNQKSTKIALISNDRNLCVKAMIHEIITVSYEKVPFEPETVITAILQIKAIAMEEDDQMMVDHDPVGETKVLDGVRANLKLSSSPSSRPRKGYRLESNDRELRRIKANNFRNTAIPDGMDPKLFELTSHIVKNLRRYLEVTVPNHLEAYYGETWKDVTDFNKSLVKQEDVVYDCRRLEQPITLLQRYWNSVFSALYGAPSKAEKAREHLNNLQSFIKTWSRVETFGLGKVYKKDLRVFLESIDVVLTGLVTEPVPRKVSPGTPSLVKHPMTRIYYDEPNKTRLINDWKGYCKLLQG